MWLLEIVILFGLAFCFVDSNYETTNSNYVGPNSEKEECNNNFEFDCFCYDEPGDNNEYSICVDQPKISDPCPKIQQTKMLVTCQRFGDWFLFGLVIAS